MAKRPEKPVSHDRRAFFRHLFVKAVEKVEETGRNFAQRASAGFNEPPTYTPPNYNYYARDQYGYHGHQQEVYGPPWPPPFGPPMPPRLRAELRERSARSVPRNA